ncbi:hypothetical protein ACUH94_03785 [Dermabacteraceae bacterium P7074]
MSTQAEPTDYDQFDPLGLGITSGPSCGPEGCTPPDPAQNAAKRPSPSAAERRAGSLDPGQKRNSSGPAAATR